MRKAIELMGKKFGRWTVIKRIYPNKGEQTMYLCKCECGTERIVQGGNLRGGTTKSCGCLKKELASKQSILNPGVASMRALIGNYKKRAEKRGIEYKLTEEQFAEITQQDCYYCGTKPNNVAKNRSCNGKYIYNGLDRVNNNNGYTVENIVPCCKICNRAKDVLNLQEFKDWVKRVYNKIFESI